MTISNKKIAHLLWSLVRSHKLMLLLGTLVRISSDIAALVVPTLISGIITFASGYAAGGPLDTFWWFISLMVGLLIYRFVFMNISKTILFSLGEQLAVDLQLRGMHHLMQLDLQWHEKENTGNKLKKVGRAGEGVDRMFRLYEGVFIEGVINIFAISAIFFQLSWELAVMMLFFAVSYFFLCRATANAISTRVRAVNNEEDVFEGLKFESMNSVQTVKSLGMYRPLSVKLDERASFLKKAIHRRIRTVRASWAFLGSYQAVFRGVLLAYTTLMVLQGHFEVGTIALVLFYFSMMEAAASEFADLYQEIILARISLAQMVDILEQKPVTETTGALPFPAKWQEFRFEKVAFSYGNKQILKGLSFIIRRGEKVGIVGISGAGKSTLMKLMLKLYDGYTGSITFDDQQLRDTQRQSFIAHVATVPQETEVFHFSLRDNIMLADTREGHSEERLQRALHIAHVDDFLGRLPEGDRTLIGEKGVKLSGGERQRLGIARAVYREPDILLLDEATSHLDAASEQKIQSALHEFFQGVTAIVIAHRLSTLKEMDRILVIKEGALVEEGTFDALLEKQGDFWKLWQKQKI